MSTITLEQGLYFRENWEDPAAVARSPGFLDAWHDDALDMALRFGNRPNGMHCPPTVFAKPIGPRHVAVVRVMDGDIGLHFHFLVVERKMYESSIRDPFMLAEKIEPTWEAKDDLPSLMIPEAAFIPRTLAQVQSVLQRVKAAALREGEDPESLDFERTMDNSESPALLGGAQILVDGGRLAFERPDGDLRMVSGLWLLLPEITRCRLWPTSFAFSSELEFDVLVTPALDDKTLDTYTTEEQAADYPQGTYEYALQHAVENGTQEDLDRVFSRRDSHATIRLGLLVLAVVSFVVLVLRFVDFGPPPANPLMPPQQKAAAAAGIIAVGEPWTALGMLIHGETLWNPQGK